MGLFDFLKGKKKEETKEIEIKQDSDKIGRASGRERVSAVV